MLSESVIEKTILFWNAHQERPHAGIEHKSPPKPEYIKKIIETIYYASQKKEEGVPIKVKVSLIEGETINKESVAYEHICFFFDKKMMFSTETLIKLAPSFDHLASSIIVSPNDLSNELAIVGVVGCSKRGRNRLESLAEYSSPPDVFTVTAKESGYLIISRGGSIICHFKDGEFYPPIPTPFHSGAMGGYMHQIIKSHPEFANFQNSYWHYYVDSLTLLLKESQHRGHGGTIIWLPQESICIAQKFIDPKYSIQFEFHPQLNYLKELLQWEDENDKMYAILQKSESVKSEYSNHLNTTTILTLRTKRKLKDYIDFLAQLTCIDGALIMTDRLQPLSFGSTLNAPKWKGEVLTGPDVLYNQLSPVDMTKKGHRHNSALDFVGSCPKSVAFVISQDGLISGMTRHNDEIIYLWSDCLNQMWEI